MQNVRKIIQSRHTYKRAAALFFAVIILMLTPVTAFADVDSDNETIDALENFKDIIIGVVKVIGAIISVFGIFQIGMSLPAHDPSQRAMGFLILAGGLMIFFADNILKTIGIPS